MFMDVYGYELLCYKATILKLTVTITFYPLIKNQFSDSAYRQLYVKYINICPNWYTDCINMAIKIAFTDVHVQCCANYHNITISKIIQIGIQVKQLVKNTHAEFKYLRTKFKMSSLKVHTFKIVLFILFVYVKIHFYFQNSGFCNQFHAETRSAQYYQ